MSPLAPESYRKATPARSGHVLESRTRAGPGDLRRRVAGRPPIGGGDERWGERGGAGGNRGPGGAWPGPPGRSGGWGRAGWPARTRPAPRRSARPRGRGGRAVRRARGRRRKPSRRSRMVLVASTWPRGSGWPRPGRGGPWPRLVSPRSDQGLAQAVVGLGVLRVRREGRAQPLDRRLVPALRLLEAAAKHPPPRRIGGRAGRGPRIDSSPSNRPSVIRHSARAKRPTGSSSSASAAASRWGRASADRPRIRRERPQARRRKGSSGVRRHERLELGGQPADVGLDRPELQHQVDQGRRVARDPVDLPEDVPRLGRPLLEAQQVDQPLPRLDRSRVGRGGAPEGPLGLGGAMRVEGDLADHRPGARIGRPGPPAPARGRPAPRDRASGPRGARPSNTRASPSSGCPSNQRPTRVSTSAQRRSAAACWMASRLSGVGIPRPRRPSATEVVRAKTAAPSHHQRRRMSGAMADRLTFDDASRIGPRPDRETRAAIRRSPAPF